MDSGERLQCVEILQGLEARYASESIGWALILLTVAVFLPKSVYMVDLNSGGVQGYFLLFVFYFFPLAVIFISLNGLFSSYLAGKIVGAVIEGNTGLPKIVNLVVNEELNESEGDGGKDYACYCMEKNCIGEMSNRAMSPRTRCIKGEIMRYLEGGSSSSTPRVDYIAGRIAWSLARSGVIGKALGDSIPCILILAFVGGIIFYPIGLGFIGVWYLGLWIVLLTLGLAGLSGYLLIAEKSGEGSIESFLEAGNVDQLVNEASDGSGSVKLDKLMGDLYGYIGSEGDSRISLFRRLLCVLGLDKASRLCLLGYPYYCVIRVDLASSSRILSGILSLLIFLFYLYFK